jgi:serine/threonine protein kinase
MSTYKPGDSVGRFVIKRFVKSGGWGEIYKALDTNTNGIVALKVLYNYQNNAVARFKREAFDATRICETHRGRSYVVNPIWVSREDEKPPHIAMEYLDGSTAADLLRAFLSPPRGAQGAPLSVGMAVDIICGAILGISEAHACGIVHRDLSLDNIFVVLGGSETGMIKILAVKVIDFGMALSSATVWQTGAGKVVGTTAYVAPEIFKKASSATVPSSSDDRTEDGKLSDQYSLAVGLYQLLTGHSPFAAVEETPDNFEAVELAIRKGWVRSIHQWQLPEPIPPELGRAIAKAMSTNPARRYDSVFEFGRAIHQFASERLRSRYADEFEDEPEERSEEPLSPESSRIQSMRVPVPGSSASRARTVVTSHDATTAPNPQLPLAGDQATMAYGPHEEEQLRAAAGLDRKSTGATINTEAPAGTAATNDAPAVDDGGVAAIPVKRLSAVREGGAGSRRRRLVATGLAAAGLIVVGALFFARPRVGREPAAAANSPAPSLPPALQTALEERKGHELPAQAAQEKSPPPPVVEPEIQVQPAAASGLLPDGGTPAIVDQKTVPNADVPKPAAELATGPAKAGAGTAGDDEAPRSDDQGDDHHKKLDKPVTKSAAAGAGRRRRAQAVAQPKGTPLPRLNDGQRPAKRPKVEPSMSDTDLGIVPP